LLFPTIEMMGGNAGRPKDLQSARNSRILPKVHFGTGLVMQRQRAIAIAAQQKADRVRLMVLASLLLLPAALLLLLISP